MPSGAEHPFPVIGVGASAGGLSALRQLCDALPPRPGLALVVVQHLDPLHESQLTDILQAHTSMTVVAAQHGSRVVRDHVYVIQPNTNVAIVDGVLSVTSRPDAKRPHYPVDHFLRSLAQVQDGCAIAVILSGTGSDGTLGISEIKAAGGITFAQDEQSAEHAGMPNSAIASGAVDMVLPPQDIAVRLAALAHYPHRAPPLADDVDAVPDDGDDFHRVIAALRHSSGVDFSHYRDTTIRRRTARRMMLRGFSSLRDYAQFLEHDRTEADALYRDVLINVTSFFRDPAVFEDLKREVFPAFGSGEGHSRPIRVWVPGCSTGQEAYSLAMALLEFLDGAKAKRSVQIFATDLGDPAALDKARAGLYPASIEAEVTPERLRKFFTKEESGYRIQKNVRDLCTFARQNVTVDPPFSRVDLVSCRNVMIYMSAALQERLLPIFHFALNPTGFLVLGLAETVGAFADLFELVNRAHKIYRKKASGTRPQLNFLSDEWQVGMPAKRELMAAQPPLDFQREADRLALAYYAPPSALVNADLEVLQFRGRTGPYLEAPPGQPTTNILRMAKEGVFLELRSALAEARAARLPVVREQLRVVDNGSEAEFTLRVLPVNVSQSADCCMLVLFESKGSPGWPAGHAAANEGLTTEAAGEAAWLRHELLANKQYLQSLVEQQEAANQALRVAHEEVLSSNEELQSTNEELETAKEELQSSNEELTTVNEQFQGRNRELGLLTDDLSNFISSANLPMVTVSRDLIVRRITPAAHQAFNLLPADLGRSLEHIKFSLDVDEIGAVIEGVIATVQPWERDVTDRMGRWWVLRVQPYRTSDGRVDGATIVAVDIDLIKRGRALLQERDSAVAIVQTVREPLVVLDGECRIQLANEAFLQLFGVAAPQVEGQRLWESNDVTWSEPALRRTLLAACAGHGTLLNLELERTVPGRGHRTLILNGRRIVGGGGPTFTLLAIEDVTDSRQAENLRIDAETLRLVDKRKDEFLGILAHELRNPLAPMRFALEVMRQSEAKPAEAVKARQVLERQVTHMIRIVDDLLDVSRITQGKVELRKEPLQLSKAVASAVELCRPTIDAAGHTLTVSLPDEAVILDADPVRLTQVLVNLLHNAVKFTAPGGHVWLIAETSGDTAEGPDQLRIRVRDTGIGIAPALLPNVFDMFMQGDLSLERTKAGLGVGLTLVRNLVGLHGGSVDVHSDGVGLGSEFTIVLPLDPSAQAPLTVAPYAAPAPTKALRILVADDNVDGRDMLTFLLRSDGHMVTAAEDGTAALEAASEFDPQVAILDIGMPGANGYDVARQLRQRPNGKSLVLIALSGLGQQEDKARAAEAGFDRHFTKPVDVNALRACMADIEPA